MSKAGEGKYTLLFCSINKIDLVALYESMINFISNSPKRWSVIYQKGKNKTTTVRVEGKSVKLFANNYR